MSDQQISSSAEDTLFVASEDNVTVIESLCENCGKQGTTRVLLTLIPFFREIVLMSFSCKHCNYRVNEVQYGGKIQPRGATFVLSVKNKEDTNRQVIKSDFATITVPHIGFEIPPSTRKGTLSTVQGFLLTAADGLSVLQAQRKEEMPDVAAKIEAIIEELRVCALGEKQFEFVIDDPSGNSYIENPKAPLFDPQLKKTDYYRNAQQSEELALNPDNDIHNEKDEIAYNDTLSSEELIPSHKHNESVVKGLRELEKDETTVTNCDELISMTERCSVCFGQGEMRSTLTRIPYFKDVLIIAFYCPHCGYRTNEVKSGGAVPEKGKKITLHNGDKSDLIRSLLKSDTCELSIPQLGIVLSMGTLGAKFTTCEGIFGDIINGLSDNPFLAGDSAEPTHKEKFNAIMNKLEKMRNGELEFTLCLDDPMASSYIQNVNAPNADPKLEIVEYERTFDQNEELGLNDMNTENYLEEKQEAK